MATLAQLQTEVWWRREVVTTPMRALGSRLVSFYGVSPFAVGTKGDGNHLRGSHRSQEWIKNSRYCTNRTYTVQSGLTATQTRYVAGFDFTPGSPELMITQCRRIMSAMKSGALEEVREFYGNIDGDKVVDGFDNLNNRAATSDSSHLWHWHLGIDRTQLDNSALMDRIFAVVTGTQTEDDMATSDQLLAEIQALRSTIENRIIAGSLDDKNALMFWLRSALDSRDPELAKVFPSWVTDSRYGLKQVMERIESLEVQSGATAADIAAELIRQLRA